MSKDSEADVVTPWTVEAKSQEGVDYSKIIKQFGCVQLTDSLIAQMERVLNKKAHHLFKRGFIFAHRDFDVILKRAEQKLPFYLYTGRGPSSEAMHLGHLLPFIINKWLQDAFNIPIVIQLTDDEKYLWKDISLDEMQKLTLENAKDIAACGFDPEKTFMFSDFSYIGSCPSFYRNMIRIQKCVTTNQAKAIFGFTDADNIGKIAFPATEAAPALCDSFPILFGNNKNIPCLIPCAIDQDPYFRMCRDVAPRLGMIKPSTLYSTFLPSLQGAQGKMSSSNENSAIFLTDNEKQIKNKINKYAFSGGGSTIEEHRSRGGNCNVDVSFQYLQMFLESDDELETIRQNYTNGSMLTGDMKKRAIEIVTEIVKSHQQKRLLITDEVLNRFFEPKQFFS